LAYVFDWLEGWFVRLHPREANPDVEAEAKAFRQHGGVGMETLHADLCGSGRRPRRRGGG
jgi:hypothetical protein